MKKKVLFISKSLKKAIYMVLFLLSSSLSFGQQVIGEFPTMDGSFESFSTPYQILGTSGATLWSTSSTSSVSRDIVTDATVARSGTNYVKFTSNATGTTRIQSPTVTTITAATVYTVQYFVKTLTTSPFSYLSGGINSTTSANANATFTPSTYAPDTWIKATATFTAPTIGASSYASVRLNGTTVPSVFSELINIDDFVVYTGGVDVTLPDSPTSPIINGLNISWTAPVTGVDGGGYVVVRYATNPNLDNDPKQNGIYKVGNTLTDGTGSLVGTIVYVGTATSFTDGVAGSLSGNDYYKVYTVDKAFNYSVEATTTTLNRNEWSENNLISIYPNPVVENQFYIALPNLISGNVAVGIYTTSGQLVYNVIETPTNNSISIHPTRIVKAGTYVVKVQNNGKESSQKIVIR